MRGLTDIIKIMYSSKDFSVKGHVKDLHDAFLIRFDDKLFLVFITESNNLKGTNPTYSYSFYSISEEKEIDSTSGLLRQLNSGFPPLDDLVISGGKFDFVKRRELEKEFDGIISQLPEKGMLSHELTDRYKAYLLAMKELKTQSLQGIYEYFIRNIEG